MAVSKRLRYEILRRDDHACRYCGAKAPDVALTIDHVLPVALGGSDKADNLVAACVDCNAGKTSSNPDGPLVDGVADDALRWAAALRLAAETQAANFEMRQRYVDEFAESWGDWNCAGEPVPMPAAWRDSIARFHDLGLEWPVLNSFIETAMTRARRGDHAEFAYLCGMAWRVLNERQEIARGLLETEGD